MISQRGILLCFILLMTPSWLAGCAEPKEDPRNGFIEVALAGPCAPDRPVLLTLTVHNANPKTWTYGCGGPGQYPDASYFSATLQGPSDHEPHPAAITNGQYTSGSMRGLKIPAGGSQEFPAVTEPLKPGTYRLHVSGGQWHLAGTAIEIVIPADPGAVEAYEKMLMTMIRHSDPIAWHIATTWPDPERNAALLRDMQSPDPKLALPAMQVLARLHPAPPGLAPAVSAVIDRMQASATPDYSQVTLLADLARRAGTDEVLRGLIQLAHGPLGEPVRAYLVQEIGRFLEPAARPALREFLTDPARMVRLAAATALANLRDPAALPVLLALAADIVPGGNSGDALYALAQYPDSPEARAAIRRGLSDPRTSSDAHRAMDRLNANMSAR